MTQPLRRSVDNVGMRCHYALPVLLLGLATVLGCTRANPASCRDGTCTDPELPFCDIDGAVAGHPFTCIAVRCDAGDFIACRGNEAITCNSVGTDYDVTECPRGCGSDGCQECSTDSECPESAPVCDPDTKRCRTCVVDDECPSTVCDSGLCAPESTIVYAAADGQSPTGATPCSHAAPCDLGNAINIATSAAAPPILRLLPGVYVQSLSIPTKTIAPLRVVALGATAAGSPSVRVTGGANVEVRGVTVVREIQCGVANTQASRLLLADSMLLNASSITADSCELDLEHSEIASNGSLVLNKGAKLTGDRLHFAPVSKTTLSAFGTEVNLTITNSLLENTFIEFLTDDLGEPGSTFNFAFNTWVIRGNEAITCRTTSNHEHLLFEDNVVVDLGGTIANVIDPTVDNGCTLRNNLLQPQAAPPPTNLVADPQFIDAAAGNFHLKSSSPAIDAAVPSTELGTDHDFDGLSRPQGPTPDIGAFESPP